MSIKNRIVNYMARKFAPIDPWGDGWWWTTANMAAQSGEVDEKTALSYSAVWACVKVISEDLASLPLHVYRRTKQGKERAADSPVYKLLHDAPNSEMTAMQFREALQAHLLLWGNAYAQIQRNLRGEPMALWPLDPTRMQVKRSGTDLIYEYRMTTGEAQIFSAQEILHIAGLGFNGLMGYPVVKYQCQTIGLGLSGQEIQLNSNKNGSRLQLAFVHPAPKAPNPEGREQFRNELRKEYGGPGGQQIGVFWEGMEPKVISQTMKDAQVVERLKLSVTEICRIFRVPPHKVMDLDRATFSNIEQQSISYVIDAIRPWAVRWEQAINSKLLGEEYFAEHLIDALMRGDITSRYGAYAVGRQWGWLSINDIRSLENMNPISEGGDIYLSPMNMTPAEDVGKTPEPQAPLNDVTVSDGTTKKLQLIKGA